MQTPEEVGFMFLIISRKWWGKGKTISLLKRKAVRESDWPKGASRQYFLYLVHKDTTVSEDGQLVFSSEQAKETGLYLGTI
jgi:hypothetical protein